MGDELMETYVHELASLYALGELDGAERAVFEEHLASGCESCAAEVSSFREVAGDLAESFAAPPPPALRQRVLKAVRRAPQAPGVLFDLAGLLLARSDEVPWEPYAPGIMQRKLFVDEARGYSTTIMRMEPGASYPPHRHTDTEELFVLSGDLRVAGIIMMSGDYCRAATNSRHPDTHTVGGCTFLLLSSDHNELLPVRK
jgi:anti-sigma factor RsiW